VFAYVLAGNLYCPIFCPENDIGKPWKTYSAFPPGCPITMAKNQLDAWESTLSLELE